MLGTPRLLALGEAVLSIVLILFIALVMLLQETGVDATAVLASAGVIGLAVGFGAQQFIRDVIAGFFILAEGLVQVGDVITLGEHTGLVEHISVRTTQIRKYSGELWSIRNGERKHTPGIVTRCRTISMQYIHIP